MAAVFRNIRRLAKGEPGAADVQALCQRLLRGEITKIAKHQIVHESPTESRTEFIGDGNPKLAEAHSSRLSGCRGPAFGQVYPTPRRKNARLFESGIPGGDPGTPPTDRYVLAGDETRVEVSDEVVGDSIGDDVHSLDYGKAVSHLAHDD